MKSDFRYDAEALRKPIAACAWYEARSAGLGEALLQDVERTISEMLRLHYFGQRDLDVIHVRVGYRIAAASGTPRRRRYS